MYKYCFVPECRNTGVSTPDKLFFPVPQGEPQRSKWIKASRRDTVKSPLSPASVVYCCEDHFDLENDVRNLLEYQLLKSAGISKRCYLNKGVVPHKFTCQKGRLISSKEPKRSVVDKLSRRKLIQQLLCEDKEPIPSTSTDVFVQEEMLPVPSIPETEVLPEVPARCDSSTPANLRCARSNKSTQAKPVCGERATQTEAPLLAYTSEGSPPSKTPRLDGDKASTASGSSVVSVGASEWTVTSSSGSSSVFTADLDDMKTKSLEVTISHIVKDPMYYIGLDPSIYGIIPIIGNEIKVSVRDLLLVLTKIKRNTPLKGLSDQFGLSVSQASRIFSSVAPKLAGELLPAYIYFPERRKVRRAVPNTFRRRYRNVVAIIDCFEVIIEKPSDPELQSLTWSEYYKANIFKFLVSCTPSGMINFVSKPYGGRITDTNLTIESGLLEKLEPGVMLMADRGFKGLAPALIAKNVELVRPPSVLSGQRLSKDVARMAKRVASLRIHVERVVGRIRVFKFLSPDSCCDHKLIPFLHTAVIIAAAFVNLNNPLFAVKK